ASKHSSHVARPLVGAPHRMQSTSRGKSTPIIPFPLWPVVRRPRVGGPSPRILLRRGAVAHRPFVPTAPPPFDRGGSRPPGPRLNRACGDWSNRSWWAPTAADPGVRSGRMPLYKEQGIVLRAAKLGEADKIVTILTQGSGKVRGVAKGIRRTNSKFGA